MDTLDSTSFDNNGSSTVDLGSDLGPLGDAASPAAQASWDQAMADAGLSGDRSLDDMGWGNAGGGLNAAFPAQATTMVSDQGAPRMMGDATGLPGLDNMAEDGTALPAAAKDQPATPASPEHHWYDRPLGLLQAVGGVGEATLGGALLAAPEPTGLTKMGGVVVGLHGLDDIQAGLRTAWTGQSTPTVTQQAVTGGAQALGASPGAAVVIGAVVDGGLGMANPEGGVGKALRSAVELSEAERAAQAGGTVARGVEGGTEAEKAAQATVKMDHTTEALKNGQTLSSGRPPIELDHVFEGEVSAGRRGLQAKGFHHAPGDGLHPNAEVSSIPIASKPNRFGVYESQVNVRDSATGQIYQKKSTMFPDNMSRDEVVKAIRNAYNNATLRQGNEFQGPSSLGFNVRGFTSGQGADMHIRTAHPLYTP